METQVEKASRALKVLPTLKRRGAELSAPAAQLAALAAVEVSAPLGADFASHLAGAGLHPLVATGIAFFQINVGRVCNQTCSHCHVDAGPDRTETMSRETAELCMRVLASTDIPTVDITGGAPEMCPQFRYLVTESRRLGRHVMDRCNLTVLNLQPQRDLVDFLAEHEVEIVASLPYWQPRQTDAQRGEGVFEESIEALRKLNAKGYGKGGKLRLTLVYNPVGAFLPPRQAAIEADFKRQLRHRHGIEIDAVYTITNMPISRFLDFLLSTNNYERYMRKLIDAYNPATVDGLMCRTMISVGWDGTLYDCDFNQMLDLRVRPEAGRHIRDFDVARHSGRRIVTGRHCFGCTAGAGSSCGGETA
jgi:radical SAM/Cys-rich protein